MISRIRTYQSRLLRLSVQARGGSQGVTDEPGGPAWGPDRALTQTQGYDDRCRVWC